MKLFRDLLYILMIYWFSFTYMEQFICILPDLYLSSLRLFMDRELSEMEYKNTTRVDLPEVDFSFHECSLVGYKIFAKACDLGSLGMIVWVVVLHWVRVCYYSYWYSVYYQQTVFIVSFCGCICLCALCHGTKNVDGYQWICLYL